VTAAELRAMRERQGWSQESLGELLKASLGKGSSTTVGKWEKGIRPVPEDVASFLGKLELDAAYPPPPDELGRTLEGQYEEPLDSGSSSSRGGPGDTAPPPPPPASAAGEERPVGQSPLPGGNTYSRVCEELWELVATGLGMVGAVTGSESLRKDGEIIAADRAALGKAYGKLAETNDTFRRMLVGMTSGGAWTEVALVSGITFGKCYRSHQAISERKQIESAAELVAEEEGYRGARDGFQGVTAAAA
jgi:transcriptional regulator with XRE-family HTH domain